ncbi:hypothetical protein Celaphus_00006306 [Cervus elaphus hippelaphus]|uniref:Uncharacterized protein n=1 Tax=Cervus elaphus hippelaphus TaxID=46360 RepID=A0A212CUZ9_CEREH|nr:hypothetical protein Celaphus_00006306 [Cervus elaphus hippelaphus]
MAATPAARAGLAAGCMARGLPFRPSCGCYQPLCWEQRAQLGCRTDSGPREYGSPLDLLQNWNWCKASVTRNEHTPSVAAPTGPSIQPHHSPKETSNKYQAKDQECDEVSQCRTGAEFRQCHILQNHTL